jgi:transposase
VALANGLNANLLRRWISESRLPAKPAIAKRTKTLVVATQTQFIALELQSSGTLATIQIELQRAGTTVRVQWPLVCAGECAAWMREVLK